MKLGLRLLLGFFVITGIAAFFVLRVFVQEVRPSVREVMEDMLVDTANVLAEMARDDLAHMPAGGTLTDTPFAKAMLQYAKRPVDARIWDLQKKSLDYRVYVTDAAGRVVFDSGTPGGASAVGEDYSRWRDVALTLTGRYGARATREVQTDDRSSVMYVAAPVMDGERVIGSLTVAKPVSTVGQFIARAERKILVQGVWLLGLSLLVGLVVTGWIVWSVRRLRHYAQDIQFGERRAPPQLSGELGELALAMGAMRERVDGRDHLEQTVRALTHELKSPMAAIAGAAELLQDELPSADRQIFARQIQDQVDRQRSLVDRMLELSKLEYRRSLDHATTLDLATCVDAAVHRARPRAAQRGISFERSGHSPAQILGESDLIDLAISNLIENAIDFSPAGSPIELAISHQGDGVHLSVRDRGAGVPDYALTRLGQRFFSTPRPAATGLTPQRGSGLGLAIVREVMALHGGRLVIGNAEPGLRAELVFPLP
ncbi:MAG: two-component system sensor histidine kinase CreC [Rhodoferax sp.]|nr:two-component system sensor histidine kinase CreC [Rhodoferax sp.]